MPTIPDSRPAVCLVAGTRPEVIKLAPVYFALRESKMLRPLWLSTGQHRHMLDQAMQAFEIEADRDLGLMQDNQAPAELSARALVAVGEYLAQVSPAAVLVQGDTTTVLSSAMAAFYQRIPIGHVEAGLRTYDLSSPWPEEMHRRLVSPLCRWSFAPTTQAIANLRSENIPPETCHLTGNTVIDALQWMHQRVRSSAETTAARGARLGISPEFMRRFLGDPSAKWILVTLHRRESFGEGLDSICRALRKVLEENPDCALVCPMHLNPNARGPVQAVLGGLPQVALIEPVGYPDFVWLMGNCRFLISDSGGVQEEAPSLGKPVLVVRNTSERMEGVQAGVCRLVGTNQERVFAEASTLLRDEADYVSRSAIRNPYGDGEAALRIRGILERDIGHL